MILSYFKKNPKKDIPHKEVVDWAVAEYKIQTGNILRDPDRAIRKLHQGGELIKVKKGVYRYDPDYVRVIDVGNFTTKIKEEIFKRDGYKCVICGRGEINGVEIQADHIKPRDKGGESTVDNGQTLCAQHNFQKKNYNSNEFGLNMFSNLLSIAVEKNDTEMCNFCKEIIAVYHKFGYK